MQTCARHTDIDLAYHSTAVVMPQCTRFLQQCPQLISGAVYIYVDQRRSCTLRVVLRWARTRRRCTVLTELKPEVRFFRKPPPQTNFVSFEGLLRIFAMVPKAERGDERREKQQAERKGQNQQVRSWRASIGW